MTNALSGSARWRPWSHRTHWGADLAVAIPLFLLEIAWLVLDWMFGLGMEIWAAQGKQDRIDAAGLAHIGRVQVALVAVLVVVVLAGIFRAYWTVLAHLLVALLAWQVLVASQQQVDHDHAPAPGCVRYDAHC
ncbi:DUF6234 family protein [Streptomyces sp. HUAS TT7]|uniref:DUF6234 family protein n=1 Tax=Streptomyces sp. HUAS TT7 TaxID=3447507 RepID=UPI003F657380